MPGSLQSKPMLVVGIVFPIVTWGFALLRLYVRRFLVKSVGLDDWLTLAATISFTVFSALIAALGYVELHFDITKTAVLKNVVDMIVANFCMYIWTTVVFKLALAVFFLRVIVSKWQRKVLYTTVILYTVYSLAFLLLNIFRCGPPALYFQREISGHCLPYVSVVGPMNYAHATMNAFTDWLFVVMPIFVVMGTQMKHSARVTVICILCLGVLGSVCSVIRLAYVKTLGTGDVLTSAPSLAMLSVAELGIGIMASCMATFRPLLNSRTGPTTYNGRSPSGAVPRSSVLRNKSTTSDAGSVPGASTGKGDMVVVQQLQVVTEQGLSI